MVLEFAGRCIAPEQHGTVIRDDLIDSFKRRRLVGMPEANGNGADSGRNTKGQFAAGHKNLGGRKRGSRNRSGEKFLADLKAEWMRSGKKALHRTAEVEPVAFCKIVSGLMPKEMLSTLNVNVHSDLRIEMRNFADAYRLVGGRLPQLLPQLIESTVEHKHPEDEQAAE